MLLLYLVTSFREMTSLISFLLFSQGMAQYLFSMLADEYCFVVKKQQIVDVEESRIIQLSRSDYLGIILFILFLLLFESGCCYLDQVVRSSNLRIWKNSPDC